MIRPYSFKEEFTAWLTIMVLIAVIYYAGGSIMEYLRLVWRIMTL